jgi:hypothetical protein
MREASRARRLWGATLGSAPTTASHSARGSRPPASQAGTTARSVVTATAWEWASVVAAAEARTSASTCSAEEKGGQPRAPALMQ